MVDALELEVAYEESWDLNLSPFCEAILAAIREINSSNGASEVAAALTFD